MRVSIRRTPPAPEMQTFDVPYTPGMSVFNVLEKVRDSIDPSLAIPISCRIGKCDICFVRVNGKVRWSCTAAPFDGMVIEPVARYVVMKDLVVDDAERSISRVHAELRLFGSELQIVDRGSTNGTYVWSDTNADWVRLVPNQVASVKPGGWVAVGSRSFVFEAEGAG